MDADDWPVLAERLLKPWPIEAIYFDLRWWEDRSRVRGVKRPGRPTLMARWGSTSHRARACINNTAAWKSPTASRPPADRQPTASRPPVATRSKLDNGGETASRPPADRQPTASRPPALIETDNRQQTQTHTPASRLWLLWKELSGTTRGKGWPAKCGVKARVKEHSEAEAASVIRWVWTSNNPEGYPSAPFLRANRTPSALAMTVFSGKFSGYLELAESQAATATPDGVDLVELVLSNATKPAAAFREALGDHYRPVIDAMRADGLTMSGYSRAPRAQDRERWVHSLRRTIANMRTA